jgi:hypothetical protein
MTNASFFAPARDLYTVYVDAKGRRTREPSQHERDLSIEVRTRLEQLDYLLDRIRDLEAVRISVDAVPNISMLVRLYSEMFYYVAARFISLLQDNPAARELSFECRTIMQIRNRLIEHPERDNGMPIISFSWRHDDGGGPVLEGRPLPGKAAFKDVGLFRNAEDLLSGFLMKLRDATASIRST